MSGSEKINVKVSKIVPINDLVTRFEFKRIGGELFPTFSGGAHTIVEMKDGGITRRNPYSLMSDPMDQHSYAISVRRDDEGRGGSLFMHNNVQVDDDMVLSYPVNFFSLDLRAKKHLMIAGGIGITPFIAQIKQLDKSHSNWELHYSVRNPALGTYATDLKLAHPNDVNVYYDDHKNFIEIKTLLDGQALGTHLYVCGPKGMIDWIVGEAVNLGWPSEAIHYEEFLAPKPGKPFQVMLSASNKLVSVGESESLLEAIEREGVDAPYLCRGGACGQCETAVIESEGEFIHMDHWLEDEEKLSRKKIMPCVSRFDGKTLVLDR